MAKSPLRAALRSPNDRVSRSKGASARHPTSTPTHLRTAAGCGYWRRI